MTVSIGRIVLYRLNQDDAKAINRRRTDGASIAERMKADPAQWPAGAQAHIGNGVKEGDEFPMMVTKLWGDGATPGVAVNGQCFLDSNDVLWVTSACEGEGPRTWSWPPRV